MTIGNNFVLWQNDEFMVKTPFNPHTPYSEGLNLVVAPIEDAASAWEDPELTGRAFALSAKVARVVIDGNFAPWVNLQANANWGLLPGATPFFHIYVYGRNKTARWGKPIILPEAPKTYQHDPMPENDRTRLAVALQNAL